MKDKIIKAVMCCLDCACQKCSYKGINNCDEVLKQDLFNLLDQQEKENNRLKAQIAVLQGWGKNNV